MAHSLCGQCYFQGFCRRLTSRAVTRRELTPVFLRNVRAHMRGKHLKPGQWKSYLLKAYQDYPGRIVDKDGNELDLDTSVFDGANVRTWFRDMTRELTAGVTPRVRKESRKRLMVAASILKALDPVAAILWGSVVANDEAGGPVSPSPVRTSDECPYRHFAIIA